MALVGIDIGGTGVKAVAYSHDGETLKYSYKEYSMKNPEMGVYYFDPRVMFETTDAVLREVCTGCGEEVLGIGCASFGESFICYDENDNIMCDSIMYFDTRGDEDIKEFSKKWPVDVLDKFGLTTPSRISSIIKMSVMNREDPGFFRKVKKIRMLPDFILSHYGGGHMVDDSMAATTRCHNVITKQWIPEMLEWAGVNPAVMPQIVPIGTAIGEVPASIAETMGVRPGAKLVSCGHDHTAASLGVGLYKKGQIMNNIGTVDLLMMIIGEEDLPGLYATQSASGRVMRPRKHISEGCYAIGAGGGGLTGGAVLKWFRDHLGLLEKDQCEKDGLSFYAEYDKKIPKEPTNLIVLPQFPTGLPSRNQAGGILNMTMATTNEEIYRAFMECETYAVYTGFKNANENIRKVEDVIALGGGAKSKDYMQIRCDVFNVPVKTMLSEQAGTHGSAMLAGVAMGVWENIEQAIIASVRVKETFYPNEKNHEYYMGMYEKYMRVHKAVNDALYPVE